MSRLRLSLTVAALAASLACGAALAQSTAPAPPPPAKTQAEPSTVTKVEDWTEAQWNAAKQKWSENKARWAACNQESETKKLSGRESWSYLYDCMTKA